MKYYNKNKNVLYIDTGKYLKLAIVGIFALLAFMFAKTSSAYEWEQTYSFGFTSVKVAGSHEWKTVILKEEDNKIYLTYNDPMMLAFSQPTEAEIKINSGQYNKITFKTNLGEYGYYFKNVYEIKFVEISQCEFKVVEKYSGAELLTIDLSCDKFFMYYEKKPIKETWVDMLSVEVIGEGDWQDVKTKYLNDKVYLYKGLDNTTLELNQPTSACIEFDDFQNEYNKIVLEIDGIKYQRDFNETWGIMQIYFLQDGTFDIYFRYSLLGRGDLRNPFKIYLMNADLMKPTIDGGAGIYVTSVDAPASLDKIKTSLSAWDNVDGDLTYKIVVEEDFYTPNKNVVGIWEILFSVTDSSGNKTTFIYNVYVKDITKAEFNGQDAYEFDVEKNESITLETILQSVTAVDNYDGNITNKIILKSENYFANKNKIGIYEIVLQVADSSNNINEFKITINNTDKGAPIINGPEGKTNIITFSIIKEKELDMTITDIIAMFTAFDKTDGDVTASCAVVKDQFTGKADKLGTYLVELKYSDVKGNYSIVVITITVKDGIPPMIFVAGYIIQVEEGITLTIEEIIQFLKVSEQIENKAIRSYKILNTSTYFDQDNKGAQSTGNYPLNFEIRYEDGSEQTMALKVNVVEKNTISVEKGRTGIQKIFHFVKMAWDYVITALKWLWNAMTTVYEWLFKANFTVLFNKKMFAIKC